MNPGEIWLVDIPKLSTHEQSGMRPAVVVARVAKTVVTIIPCTGNLLALRFPFTHLIESSNINGLSAPSVALIFHIRAIDVVYLKKKIGKTDKKTMAEIRKLARKLIG